ncbi:MAG: hypothetical protein K0V04_33025 [Deltaproteobacteria bacterium]|nr:hypothetical protein [Deltaproteobacteria bacterium]
MTALKFGKVRYGLYQAQRDGHYYEIENTGGEGWKTSHGLTAGSTTTEVIEFGIRRARLADAKTDAEQHYLGGNG